MTAISGLERLLERLVERTLARAFRPPLRTIQVERRIERTMDAAVRTVAGRLEVPDRYRVRISPTDLPGLGGGEPATLAAELAGVALAYARQRRYHLAARPTVDVVADRSLARGAVEVDAVARRPGAGSSGAPRVDPDRIAHGVDRPPAGPSAGPQPAGAWPADPQPAGAMPADRARPLPEASGPIGLPEHTRPFRRPVPDVPGALLREIGPDGIERTVELEGLPLSIGRARENGLVLRDGGVSRHHGRLQARRGALVYTDLGSTNGSWVNGIRVDEIALGLGDQLRLGSTVLIVERLAD
jgi:hypothetical protein